jgi:hypothetical protein
VQHRSHSTHYRSLSDNASTGPSSRGRVCALCCALYCRSLLSRVSALYCQPQKRNYAPARSKVLVCEGRYGSMAIEYRGRPLRWREIAAPAKPQVLDTPARNARPSVPISVKKRKWAPSANHPWHQAIRREVQKRVSKSAATASRPSLAWPSASP